MPHILQHPKRTIYQFMALITVDIYYHSHATCIMFVRWLIESLIITFCHIIRVISYFISVFVCKDIAK